MREAPTIPDISTRDLLSLERELRRELARLERGSVTDAFSHERDELLLALQRLNDGSYGICAGCAVRVPVERLEVMPATRWCVSCAR